MIVIFLMLVFLLILIILYHLLSYHVLPYITCNVYSIDFSKTKTNISYIVSGFYSEKYIKNYLELEKSFFKTHPNGNFQFIQIDQNEMDQCLKHCSSLGVLNKFTGCTIKIKMVSKIIRRNIGRYVLYCEADVLFLKPVDKLVTYYANFGYDIVLANFGVVKLGTYSVMQPNTGVMLMKCTESLARTMDAMCDEIESKCAWDEAYMVEALMKSKHKLTLFPLNYVSDINMISSQTMIVKFANTKDKLASQRALAKQLQ